MPLPPYLTFDCYGTLIDFDLTPTTLRLLDDRGATVNRAVFLSTFRALRLEEVRGPYRPYREVLARSLARTMAQFGVSFQAQDGQALVDAVRTFEPFPEVPPVLARLAASCRLVIVSNSDDDLIAPNAARLGVPFHRIITAEQSRAYKPSLAMFEYVLTTLGCTPDDLIHVAQGWHYDIVPTSALGWRRVWINRQGLPGDPAAGPYGELPDLTGLPALLGIVPSA
jgi:2-haloacid dehalogenase